MGCCFCFGLLFLNQRTAAVPTVMNTAMAKNTVVPMEKGLFLGLAGMAGGVFSEVDVAELLELLYEPKGGTLFLASGSGVVCGFSVDEVFTVSLEGVEVLGVFLLGAGVSVEVVLEGVFMLGGVGGVGLVGGVGVCIRLPPLS